LDECKPLVVGHCNDRVGHPRAGRAERGGDFAEETRFFFICDCCESCGEEDFGHGLPERYAARHRRFWTGGEESEHSLIMFEYRTVCTRNPKLIHYRLDSRMEWYNRELPEIFKVMAEETRPAGCPSAADTSSSSSSASSAPPSSSSSSSPSCLTGKALPRGWNDPVVSGSGVVGAARFGAEWMGPEEDTYTNEDTQWGRCALHALLQPSPAVQRAAAPLLARLAEQGDHRPLVGLHIRTLAVDVLRCIPLDTPKTWEGVDYAFLHKDPKGEPAESCRQSPYVCRDKPLFWLDVIGSLSGYFRCALRVAGLGLPFANAREGMDTSLDARLFVTTDSTVLHKFFAEQAEGEGEVPASGATMYGGPDGAAAMVPTWNNLNFGPVDKLLVGTAVQIEFS
jgi:hypothetical protein